MSNIDVNILSRNFNIACPEEKHETLKSAATMLDSELQTLKQAMSSGVDFEKLVVTAALNFCARYERLVNEFEEQMTIIMNTNNSLSDTLETLPDAPEAQAFSALMGMSVAEQNASQENVEVSSSDESDDDTEVFLSESSDGSENDDSPSFHDLDSLDDQPIKGFDSGDSFSFDDELDFVPAESDDEDKD